MKREEEIGKILSANDLTISIAESCTGGLISHRLTNVPGSSKYFKGGIVAYSNEIKIKVLRVNSKTIQNFGAVSFKTASEMAIAIKKLTNSDIGLGVTGIAGPSGVSMKKPVGTVFIAIATTEGVEVKKFRFYGTREEIKNKTADSVFDMVIDKFTKN